MTNDMNKCDDIRRQLFEINSNESLSDAMTKHLDQCTACASYYQDILTLNQGLQSMPEHDVSDEVFNQTLANIQAEKTDSKSKGINPQWAIGLAASFVLVAVAGLIYNGSISEFQVDFNQISAASEPESELEMRSNRQQPAEKSEFYAEDSDTSVDVVYIEDLSIDTEVQTMKMSPAKPAPAVKNTMNEILADQPLEAPTMQVQINGAKSFDDAKVAADRMMQGDKENDMNGQDQFGAKVESVSVTGTRIKREEPKDSGPMSLDQLLKTASESPNNREEEAVFAAQRLKVAKEKAKDESAVRTDRHMLPAESMVGERLRGNGPMRPLDQLLNTVSRAATEGSAENLKRELQFKKQGNQLAKEKAKLAEPSAEVDSMGDLTEAKKQDLKPKPAIQPRGDVINDGLFASVEENELIGSIDTLGGVLGGHSPGRSSTVVDESAAIKYLAELQVTDQLNFKSATGYWANTYVPGDSNMRWIQAQLKQDNDLKLPAVHQNIQPFDYPSNAALGLYLNSDHKTLNETGPTRMRLQVGIQAGQQKGGHRSALNLAVVLDLNIQSDQQQTSSSDLKQESKALLDALLKTKQPADQISVYVTGVGQVITADNFRHGPIQVALNKIFTDESISNKPAQEHINFELFQILSTANVWLKTQDDPNAVLGSSAVLLVSANTALTASPEIESLVQQNAIDGITLSTVSLAGIEPKSQLEKLALMGQGHSRVLAGIQDAQRLINQELMVSSRAVARALRLQIKLAEGVQLIDVLDSYSLDEAQAQRVRDAEQSLDQRMSENLGITADRGKDDDGIQMVIPSYFAGDTHVILLDVLVQKPGPVAEVSAKYKDLIYLRNATSQKNLHMSSGQNQLGPLELNVMKNMLAQRMSRTVSEVSHTIRVGDLSTTVLKLNTILELYQAMRQHIRAWKSDAEMMQDETTIQHYLQLLNSQSSINPKQYQLIADSLSFMSWRKLISHSP